MSVYSTERYVDEEAAFRAAFAGLQSGIWTAEPGIIQSVIAADGTVSVQLALKGTISNPDGTTTQTTIVNLQKCPVKFFGGGGLYITHPTAIGDECLVIFARRCIDTWWQQGGNQPPLEGRLHDINDGFCIPGIFSVPNAFASVSQVSLQVRTKTTVLMDITSSLLTINIPVQVNNTITSTGDQVAGTISQMMHTHPYMPGSGSMTETGEPVG